jgi:hypothetical protein
MRIRTCGFVESVSDFIKQSLPVDSDSIYADYIFKDNDTLSSFTEKLKESITYFESNEAFTNERLLAYINTSNIIYFFNYIIDIFLRG